MGELTMAAVESRTPVSAAPVSVARADDTMGPAWDSFVASQPGGSFYHLFGWKSLNERELRHDCEYVAARNAAGVIEGILPLVMVKSRLFGRILCSVPFMNFGGPIAANAAAEMALTEHAMERARALNAKYLELRCASPLQTEMPASLRKVSLTVPLTADPEALWNSFSPKHRKNVRRAQKNNLEVRVGGIELLPDFYSVLEQSWRSLGTPLYSLKYFQRILEVFPNNTTVFICHLQGKAAGVALTGHYNGTVEGMWAGVQPELRQLQPNYVLYWEMLRHACTQGYSKFHLGRSTADSGAEQFKSKWNAEAHQLYWYFHRPQGGEVPQLNVDNPKYQLAIAVWRRLPLWTTRMIGPGLARLIP